MDREAHLEVEADAQLIRDSDQLKERIRYLFLMPQQSADEELERGGDAGQSPSSPSLAS